MAQQRQQERRSSDVSLQQQQSPTSGVSSFRRPSSPFLKPPKIIRNHGDHSLYVKLSDLPDALRKQIRQLHEDGDGDSADADKHSLHHHPLEEPMSLSAQPTLEEIQMCYAQIDLAILMENPPSSPPVLNIRPRSVSPAKVFQRHRQHGSSNEALYEEWRNRRDRRDEASAGGGGGGKDQTMKELLAGMPIGGGGGGGGAGTSCCSGRSAMAKQQISKKNRKQNGGGGSEYDDGYDYDDEEFEDEDEEMEMDGDKDGGHGRSMFNSSSLLRADYQHNYSPYNGAFDKSSKKKMEKLAAAAAAAAAAAGGRSLQMPVWTDNSPSRSQYESTWAGSSHVDMVDPCHVGGES